MILTDHETQVDLLNNAAIAQTITNLIQQRRDRPITIGVHGDWGAGKSSILEMIEVLHQGQPEVMCLKFNGWRFQGFEDAKIALLEGIVQELVNKKPEENIQQKARAVFQRIDWLKVAKKSAGATFTAVTGIPLPGQLQDAAGALQAIMDDPEKGVSKENLDKVLGEVLGILKPEETRNVPKEVGEFQAAFRALLQEAGLKQLIVLIDDLDRCLPDTAIETLEAVRLFMFTEHTAFVVAADEGMIEYAVRKHFPDLPESTNAMSYSRNYLEKLIQVPFRIPALGHFETHIYVTLLLVGNVLGEDAPDFQRFLEVARQKLQKPWVGEPLTVQDLQLQQAATEHSVALQEAVTLSEQIVPMLSGGTRGNPRQIKRFLNTLLLRHEAAQARGFADAVQLPVLAKLMLAERFLDAVYDCIAEHAAIDPEGQSHDLAALEAHMAAPEAASAGPMSETLKGWLESSDVKRWAGLLPAIGQLDLRPYLFVAKDRKDYFSAVSALGSLREIARKLMGSKLQVAGLTAALGALKPQEAEQVFSLVKSQVTNSNRFETQPEGVEGLVALAKVHPALQARLLDLLETLPADRVGPWVARGWQGVLTDAHCKGRYEVLCGKWKQVGSDILKEALSLSTRREAN